MSTPLYQIANEYRELTDKLENLELNEEEVWSAMAVEDALYDKAEAVANSILNLQYLAKAVDERIESLKARSEKLKKREESIRNYLMHTMKTIGKHKLEFIDFSVVIRKNPPSVHIIDEDALPDHYFVSPPFPGLKLDKKTLLQDLKDGMIVSGATLAQSERIDIK